ncbi:response regulator transcription factor [Gulosibacter molinativorax]|uniref:DNA-binding response regulator n=1 Tax=Gulosibacter molinativorax TaxID=256821 RepID=A0ABT7C8F1_9MICO|nr:response regulator transcription factor [Gulosibacter molinativorax]MDJ1371452.1 DNA-binding response regulator [Gulosibacter molinativorax]QUY62950.1 LipReg1 [Gulosibacter molinativorax]
MDAVAELKVILADDEALIRAGLRLVLDGNRGISIVGEATNGAEAARMARELRPDVVLMDVRMPVLDGVAATAQVRSQPDAPAVVVLTAFDTDEFVLGALRAGASGFLLKHTPPPQLVDTILQAAAGILSFSPEALERLVNAAAEPSPAASSIVATLSARELEIATLVAEGLTNAEIAQRLYLSLPTVKTHLGRIFEKLGVTNRVQAALLIHDAGRAAGTSAG